MFNLVQLAFRNIFRNPRRTILTEITIITGIIVIILASGIMKAMEITWRDDLIYADIGHVQIMAKGLNEGGGLKNSITDSSKIINDLKKYKKEIVGFSRRIDVNGLISSGEDTQMFIGSGVEPRQHIDMFPKLEKNIIKGRFFKPQEIDGAVIGEGLAKKLKIKIDSVLTLAANDKNDSFNGVNIKVTGIVSISDDFSNDHLVLFNINNARILTSYDPDEISKIVIIIHDTNKALKFKNLLKNDFTTNNQIEIFSWHSLSGMLNSVVSLMSTVNIILIAILLALTLVSIMNTTLMSVFERTREIGTIMAIGSSPCQVMVIFIFESFFIGLIGVIIGVSLGLLLNFILVMIGGLHFSPPGQTSEVILIPQVLPGRIVLVSILVLLISLLSSLYPSRHAVKQRPVDALRAN